MKMFYHHDNIYKIVSASCINQILNIVCFINSNSNIYQHNDIYAKIISASQYFSQKL